MRDPDLRRYRNQRHGSLPPHAFAESEDALQQLVHKHVNQAIVICGESGAGKTETTKLMLHYLAVVAKSGKAQLLEKSRGSSGNARSDDRRSSPQRPREERVNTLYSKEV